MSVATHLTSGEQESQQKKHLTGTKTKCLDDSCSALKTHKEPNQKPGTEFWPRHFKKYLLSADSERHHAWG